MGIKHLWVEVFDINGQICNLATYTYFRQPGGRRTKNFGGKNFGEIFQDFGRKKFGGKNFGAILLHFGGKNFGEQFRRNFFPPKFLVNNVCHPVVERGSPKCTNTIRDLLSLI